MFRVIQDKRASDIAGFATVPQISAISAKIRVQAGTGLEIVAPVITVITLMSSGHPTCGHQVIRSSPCQPTCGHQVIRSSLCQPTWSLPVITVITFFGQMCDYLKSRYGWKNTEWYPAKIPMKAKSTYGRAKRLKGGCMTLLFRDQELLLFPKRYAFLENYIFQNIVLTK